MCKLVLQSEQLVKLIKEENYSTDFVYGFIQAMDGEKDPRNLICVTEIIFAFVFFLLLTFL